jgi:radical SAM superfamily enzyme YgiQ (UPF0313 family)
MKKLLLLKPDYNFFPIGIAHVITALRKNSIPYDFFDLGIDDLGWKAALESSDYLAVATGGLCGDFNAITAIAREAKRISPGTPLIIGGNITYDAPKRVLFAHLPVDFLVIGEGERTFPELLTGLATMNGALPDIDGIAYRDEAGKIVQTRPRKWLSLQDADAYPTWEDIDMQRYINIGVGGFPGFMAVPVLTGRGCTGRCTFCSPTNGPFRMRRVDHVIAELEALNSAYAFEGFAFINEIFYPTFKMVQAFADAYRASGIGKPWVCLLRVDVGEDVLRLMKDAGCIGISFGVESGSDEMLKNLNKHTTVDQIKRFYRATKRLQIPAFGSFMLGNEGETERQMSQTIDLLIEEKISGPFGLVISYPGTDIYRHALAGGQIGDEFEYLKNLDFSQILQNGTFRNIGYLNISAMPDHQFFHAAMRQLRRHTNDLYHRMSALDVNLDTLTGICPVCGKLLDLPHKPDTILGMESACAGCFNTVYFNLYGHQRFRGHAQKLHDALHDKQRIAVIGTGVNARLIQCYSPFGPDPARICCYVSDDGFLRGRYFFNQKVIGLEDLPQLNVDFILIADTFNPDLLKQQLRRLGFAHSMMESVLPADWPRYLKHLYDRGKETQREHLLRIDFPESGSTAFVTMARQVGEEIIEVAGEGAVLALMPAGGFAQALAPSLERCGLQVAGFMDNLKWKSQSELNGKPLVKPEDARVLTCEKIVIATPNHKAQLEMKAQLMSVCGASIEKNLLLFADLFLQSRIRNSG